MQGVLNVSQETATWNTFTVPNLNSLEHATRPLLLRRLNMLLEFLVDGAKPHFELTERLVASLKVSQGWSSKARFSKHGNFIGNCFKHVSVVASLSLCTIGLMAWYTQVLCFQGRFAIVTLLFGLRGILLGGLGCYDKFPCE